MGMAGSVQAPGQGKWRLPLWSGLRVGSALDQKLSVRGPQSGWATAPWPGGEARQGPWVRLERPVGPESQNGEKTRQALPGLARVSLWRKPPSGKWIKNTFLEEPRDEGTRGRLSEEG